MSRHVPATADEAITAAWRAATRDTDGTLIVHTATLGSNLILGADWTIHEIIAALRDAKELMWFDDFMGHDLAVKTADNRFYKFAIPRPKEQ